MLGLLILQNNFSDLKNFRATKLLRPISDKPIVLSPNKKKRAKLTFAKNETESDETKEVKSTNMETEEKILDTGRLFIRNLAYRFSNFVW